MKKGIAAALVLLMLTSAGAFAAEWPEGLGPARPYEDLPEVNLSSTLGYVIAYPLGAAEDAHYCGALTLYLPREDAALGEGSLGVYDEDGQVAEVSFTDADNVRLRAMTEEELDRAHWGGGVAVEARLPKSLDLNRRYYALMDEGCVTAADGAVRSKAMEDEETWPIELKVDFGVGGLEYERAGAPVRSPAKGDRIRFRLEIGGWAKYAVVFTDNNSVRFSDVEYTESMDVTGEVVSGDVNWGVLFLSESGDVLDVVRVETPEGQP